ncbi:MAG: fibronectin type III domain-containing protein [Patescibacteria group bacterium]|nr:fibronectin type III domain-containing protein [Patescibacteria group bacterium]
MKKEKNDKNNQGIGRKLLAFLAKNGFVFAIIVFALVVFCYIDSNFLTDSSDRIGMLNLGSGARSGIVLGEEDPSKEEKMFRSENFKLAQVTFGGGMTMSLDGPGGIEIRDVRSELVTSKKRDEIQLLVSWKTSKTSLGEIEYSRSGEQSAKKKKEDRYSYAHSLILSPLDPATAYGFVITAKDQIGREVKSDRFAFYTGAPNISIIEMLTKATRDVFGWAIRK